MKTIACLFAALALTACGGDEQTDAPIAQCNGTPKAAIVYVGTAPFPELRTLPNACVYSTAAQTVPELAAVVDTARAAAGTPRAYLVGAYTALPLAYRAANPGKGDITSLWFTPATSVPGTIPDSIAFVYLNTGPWGEQDCHALTAALIAQHTFAECDVWPQAVDFGPAERTAALKQLHLDLIK